MSPAVASIRPCSCYSWQTFGGAVDNRLTFHATRGADGTVRGSFNYEQTDFGAGGGVPQTYKGSVACFKVYDTPVLQNFPDIPAQSGNRA